MKILMISHMYPTPGDSVYGSFVHSQTKEMIKQGHSVEVVAPTAFAPFPLNRISAKWRRYSQVPSKVVLEGVPVTYPRTIRTPGAVLFELAGWFYWQSLLKPVLAMHQRNPFSLIHAQVGYPDGWAAARLAAKLQLPLVITCHGQELQIIAQKNAKLRRMVSDTLNRASAVVVVSEKLMSLACQLGVSNAKLHLVANGVDQLAAASLPPALADRLQGKKVMLSVSALIEQKGIQDNIRAVALLKERHPDLVYLVVGDGPISSRLRQLTAEHDLEDSVIFVGAIEHNNIGACYSRADIFALPSRNESFGMVYLEAMQLGLPVIGCTGEGIMPQIVERQAGLATEWDNPSGLARAISQVLSDSSLAEKMSTNACQLASEFTWPSNVENLLSVYKQALHASEGDKHD